MNKKLILLSCLILILQSTVVDCAQGWRDWLRTTLYGSQSPKAKVKSTTAPSSLDSYTAGVIGGMGVVAGGVLVGRGIETSLYWKDVVWRDISYGMIILTLYSAISSIIQSNVNRKDKIDYIRSWIRVILNNSLLYPTRSSKLHVLLKKDDFLRYKNLYDKTNILDEVCNLVSEEISAAPYSEEEREQDRQIDQYMAILRGNLANVSDLSLQIKALEGLQNKQGSIIEMRGYLSIYYRLKNQLKYEETLTPEQKQQLYGWKLQAQEAVSKLSPEELALRKEKLEEEQKKLKAIPGQYAGQTKEQLLKLSGEKALEMKEKREAEEKGKGAQ